ncbi:hypothetical protein [Haloarcula sp. Atlit-120R]|nr:hypothetical protein [Haloarcula sp. Atlit-120R]
MTNHKAEHDDTGAELGNGDTLAERLEDIDIDEDETCSSDEMRERLDL